MHKISRGKIEIIIGIILISIFCLETIGYAHYNRVVNIGGNVTLKKEGIVQITNISVSDLKNAYEVSPVTYSNVTANFNVRYSVTDISKDYSISYDVTIDNDTSYDYVFKANDINVDININDGSLIYYELDGINIGDTIPKKSSKTFVFKLILEPKSENTEYDIEGSTDINCSEETNGYVLVAISDPKNGDLSGTNKVAHFKVDATNIFEVDKIFNLSINSSAFELCDSKGNTLNNPSYTVKPGDIQSFDFYVKLKPNASLPNSIEYLSIMYNYDDKASSAGTVSIKVDVNYVEDNDPPLISNVVATQNSNENNVKVSWDAYDINTVNKYYVMAYNSSNKLINTFQTEGSETVLNIQLGSTGKNIDGTYYFKVYGIDTSTPTPNSGESYCSSASVSQGYCSKSVNTDFKWYAKITYSGSFTSGSVTETLLGKDFTTTISGQALSYPTFNYVRLTGSNTNFTSSQYTEETNNYNLSITVKASAVTGDITINTNSRCLVEGTKILLANGTYKNIEDITYHDLLAVWDYDRGSIIYEYPIWIEKKHTSDLYQLTTFSDGTELKTVGHHGVFSLDLNKFVSVDNNQEFTIGSRIAKVEDGKIKEVKVTGIEKIYEPVNYYHIVSSRYYNVIANDLITTDGSVFLSNIYKFNSNIKWLNKPVNDTKIYSYDLFKDSVPYYMYYGMRMGESIYLKQFGMDLQTFKYYLSENQLNYDMILPYPEINNRKIFKVSTSEGFSEKLLEGSVFIVPKGSWLNSVDNKIYNTNEKLIVSSSIHLIKI